MVSLIEAIKSPEKQISLIEYAEALEKKHVDGLTTETLKGTLGVLKVQALLQMYIADQEDLVVVEKPKKKARKAKATQSVDTCM